MKLLRHILLCGCSAVLCGCGNPDAAISDTSSNAQVAPDSFVLIDVRSADEFASGHLRGAVNIPHDRITDEIGSVAADKSTRIILYCRSGRRAAPRWPSGKESTCKARDVGLIPKLGRSPGERNGNQIGRAHV